MITRGCKKVVVNHFMTMSHHENIFLNKAQWFKRGSPIVVLPEMGQKCWQVKLVYFFYSKQPSTHLP